VELALPAVLAGNGSSESVEVLKGRGFSRADNGSRTNGALAPEERLECSAEPEQSFLGVVN
jgi:hypothetical protein